MHAEHSNEMILDFLFSVFDPLNPLSFDLIELPRAQSDQKAQ